MAARAMNLRPGQGGQVPRPAVIIHQFPSVDLFIRIILQDHLQLVVHEAHHQRQIQADEGRDLPTLADAAEVVMNNFNGVRPKSEKGR